MLGEGIIAAHRRDPDVTPTQLAERFGCSHVTVRKVLRDTGLYVPRGVLRLPVPSTPQTEAQMVVALQDSLAMLKRRKK